MLIYKVWYIFISNQICLKLEKLFFDFKPDGIINFAAESHVDRSIDTPRSFIETNVLGTFELLNASLKLS